MSVAKIAGHLISTNHELQYILSANKSDHFPASPQASASCGRNSSMARRSSNWDLSHLAAKYPWLRVDSDTIQEFRSPFQWIPFDVQEAGKSDDQTLERDSEELFSLKRTRAGRHRGAKQYKKRTQHTHPGRRSPNQRPGSTGRPLVAAIEPLSKREDDSFPAMKQSDDAAASALLLQPRSVEDRQAPRQRNAAKKQKQPKKPHNFLSLR